MLHWHSQYSRTRLTLTAHSLTGHTFRITSTGIMHPVHLGMQSPGQKNPTRVATVPSIPLAKLCAEHHNIHNLRVEANREEEDSLTRQRRDQARKAQQDMRDGPKDHFIISVPKCQSLNAQYALTQTGIQVQMEAHFPAEEYQVGHLVPETGIRKAVNAVNEDLDSMGMGPKLTTPPLLGNIDNPLEWLDLLHREFRWEAHEKISARLWQARGEDWRNVAKRHPRLVEKDTAETHARG